MKRVMVTVVFGAACLPGSLLAQVDGCDSRESETYRLSLRNRPSFITPPSEVQLEIQRRDRDNEVVHALIQLCRPPTRAEIARLGEAGITVLAVVAGTTYEAAIARSLAEDLASPRGLAALPDDLRGSTRWIGTVTSELKQEPALLTGRLPPYGVDADGMLRLLVAFYDDVTDRQALAVLDAVDARYEQHANHVWRVTLNRANLPALAAADQVRSVELAVPYIPLNDRTRAAIGVDALQTGSVPPVFAGLTGKGTRVAVMDEPIDIEHDDFWGHDADGHRVGLRVAHHVAGASLHGTHVAGTIGGNGYQSDGENAANVANGGMPFQWRGMAPEATLLSFEVGLPGVGDVARLYDAIVVNGAHVSNHSYVHDCAAYTTTAEIVDRVLRGDQVHNGEPLPARAYIAAAGNNGQFGAECVASGYFSVLASAKNAIAVGNVFTSNVGGVLSFVLSPNSSLGPTPDSRLKPDLVAPGCNLQSLEIKSTVTEYFGTEYPNAQPNGYEGDCGTSMAAAAVTGTTALLLQQWREAFGCDDCSPLPSTLKAVLVQGAQDLEDNVGYRPNQDTLSPSVQNVVYGKGPDYATGYGVIDAVGARDIIQPGPGPGRRLLESDVLAQGEVDEYEIVVPPGATSLKVTLAWDDPPASVTAAQIASKLVNDLDLVLVRPGGTESLPWVLPIVTPSLNSAGDHDPSAAEMIIQSTLQAAPGVDRRNNVEQVEVDNPAVGTWIVRVTAYSIQSLYGLQAYSLASNLALSGGYTTFSFGPSTNTAPCVELDWFPFEGGIRFQFPGPSCGFVPLRPICRYVIGCPGCGATGICPPIDLVFSDLPEPFRLYIHNHETGESAPVDSPDRGRTLVLRWRPEEDVRHSIVFAPDGAVDRGATYTIGIGRN